MISWLKHCSIGFPGFPGFPGFQGVRESDKPQPNPVLLVKETRESVTFAQTFQKLQAQEVLSPSDKLKALFQNEDGSPLTNRELVTATRQTLLKNCLDKLMAINPDTESSTTWTFNHYYKAAELFPTMANRDLTFTTPEEAWEKVVIILVCKEYGHNGPSDMLQRLLNASSDSTGVKNFNSRLLNFKLKEATMDGNSEIITVDRAACADRSAITIRQWFENNGFVLFPEPRNPR